MENSEQGHKCRILYHEPLDKERDTASVGSSTFTFSFPGLLFVLCSAVIRQLEDRDAILNAYDRFGPTPRICFNNENGLAAQEVRVRQALNNLSSEMLRKVVPNVVTSHTVDVDDVPHLLFLLQRMPTNMVQQQTWSTAR